MRLTAHAPPSPMPVAAGLDGRDRAEQSWRAVLLAAEQQDFGCRSWGWVPQVCASEDCNGGNVMQSAYRRADEEEESG